MDDKPSPSPTKFGTILGLAPGGVPAYSSDYPTADDTLLPESRSYRSSIDGTFLGYKWQCVKFARHWPYLTKGYIFDDIPMANASDGCGRPGPGKPLSIKSEPSAKTTKTNWPIINPAKNTAVRRGLLMCSCVRT